MCPHDGEAFLSEHLHDGREQPIVTGERGASDTGEDSHALRVRAQIADRGAPHRPDQDDVLGSGGVSAIAECGQRRPFG